MLKEMVKNLFSSIAQPANKTRLNEIRQANAVPQTYGSPIINISHCMPATLKQTANKPKNKRAIRSDTMYF